MPYTPIVATLGYVLSPDRASVLMIHRNARPGDLHLGKYNGLGGKLEPDEDIVACMRRELREEAAIEALALTLRGTVSWPGFGKGGEDWLGFIFLITAFSGEPPAAIYSGVAYGEVPDQAYALSSMALLSDGQGYRLTVFSVDQRALATTVGSTTFTP